MTKQELSHLYWLKKEIAENQRRLKELENEAYQCMAQLTGAPSVGGHADKSGNLATLIADQKDLLARQIEQAWNEYERLSRYIASVEDPQMRLILSLRYVDGLRWQDVALRMGEQDESYPRRKHNKFLQKCKVAENAETSVL